MNKELLRSIMVLHGETYADLANLLGISKTSLSTKINAAGTEFKQSEIAKIRKHYKLKPKEVIAIFFAD